MIVDDKEDLLETMSMFLVGTGQQVYAYQEPIKALDFARKNKLDLIITDVLMPVLNGYDLYKQLRNIDHIKKIPIISMSGGAVDACNNTLLENMKKETSLFLKKPIRPTVLQEAVEHTLGMIGDHRD